MDNDVVDGVLSRLVTRLRARDVDGIMELFSDDAALFGSAAGEYAQGAPGLRAFFTAIVGAPTTYGWTWERPLVASHGEVLWFVASAIVNLEGDDGVVQTLPYRLSGVLRERTPGGWVFELFNGSEPTQP